MKLADGSCDHEFLFDDLDRYVLYYCDLCGRLEIVNWNNTILKVYETKASKNETKT